MRWRRTNRLVSITLALILLAGCQAQEAPDQTPDLDDLAARYAGAWSGQDPVAFSNFYADNGSFRINDGDASIGREAIAGTASSFMASFPDMVVRLVEVREVDDHVEFHWHWTGTHAASGRSVDLRGFERWTLDDAGLILESLGHMDDAEYQRQLAADPDPQRFADSIAAFTAWDSKNAFPENAFLFVGSSSVRLWSTAEAFPGRPVINRGFGGSELSDVMHYYDQIILPYSPATIFLYAGDNDIAHGKSAARVFADYMAIIERVRSDLPGTELVFLAVKPSKARWGKWPVMLEANRMVREYVAGKDNLGYADVATPLLGDDGQPLDVFVADGLHLNEAGYRLWREALAPFFDT